MSMEFDWTTRNELIEIEHYGEKARTERAVLYAFDDEDRWIPISLIDYEDDEIIRIPRWKAEQFDLVEDKIWGTTNLMGDTEEIEKMDFDSDRVIRKDEALRAVLLFFSATPWDSDKSDAWKRLTGSDVCTTKVLCDVCRAAL